MLWSAFMRRSGPSAVTRRQFVTGATAAVAAGGRKGRASTSGDATKARIALMAFGLDRIIKTNKPAAPERTLDVMDVAELAADQWGLHKVELQSPYFAATERSWLHDLKARYAKTRTQIVQINIEMGPGYDMSASAAQRLAMIDRHRAWIDHAAFLECPRVLLNQGTPTLENRALTIANFKAVVELAKARHIVASCENRNGRRRGGTVDAGAPDAPPSYVLLADVLKASGTRACVDFLNFPNQQEQLAGIRALLPITSGLVHAGLVYELPPALAICRELGYAGLYSIKASGRQGPSPIENTTKILEALLATL